MIGIYKVTNTIDNKCYIGQSWNIEERWKGYLKIRKGCANIFFLRALKKHGIESFSFEVLVEFKENEATQAILDTLEEEYIVKFNTLDKMHGYNLRHGGNGGSPSAEVAAKISRAKLGKKLTDEHRRHISESKKGAYTGRKRPWTDEGKASYKEKRSKPISQEELAMRMAANEKRLRETGSRYFLSAEERARRSRLLSERSRKTRKVLCVTTGVEYSSLAEASAACGGHASNIAAACRGKIKTCKSFEWKYLD